MTVQDFLDKIPDFFEAPELVEYLGVSTEDILEMFREEILALQDEIEELMEIKHG